MSLCFRIELGAAITFNGCEGSAQRVFYVYASSEEKALDTFKTFALVEKKDCLVANIRQCELPTVEWFDNRPSGRPITSKLNGKKET